MLKIIKKLHFRLPHRAVTVPGPMQFARVPADNDELSQAIAEDPAQHDDTWRLSERPDSRELEQYWAMVEDDILHDPEWFRADDASDTV